MQLNLPGSNPITTTATATAPAVGSQTTAPTDVKAHTVKKASLVGNWLTDTTTVVENMNQGECLAQLPELAQKSDRSWFAIGGILKRVQEQQWWSIRGYQSFSSFIEEELGIPKARGEHWMKVYTGIVNMGITSEDLDGIGWTKIKDAIPYMRKENKDELLAMARSMTVINFQIYLKGLSGATKKAGSGAAGRGNNDIHALKMQFHSDQWDVVEVALDRAKTAQNTEYDAVAFTSICEQYMADGSTGGHVTEGALILALQTMGDEGLSGILNRAFPHLTITMSEAEAFDPNSIGKDHL